MAVNLNIAILGSKFQDYRQGIPGDSFGWGPVITTTAINAFTFHHSVTKQTAKNDGNWKAECDTIANLHINQGWGGIGYRFVICSDGTVAYVGDLGRGGSAVADHNDHMFSACFVGDFTKELPTAAQVHSAHLLAKFFLTEMPQYPNLSTWDQVKGHKDFNATACPGSNWSGADSLRDRIINDRFTGYPDPQPVNVTPPTPVPQPTPTPPVDCEKVVAGLKARNTDLTNQLVISNAEVTNREEQVVRLKQQVLENDQLRESLIEKANQSAKKLDETVKVYEGSLQAKQKTIDAQGVQLGAKNKQIATLQAENQKLKTSATAALTISDLFAALAKKFAGK